MHISPPAHASAALGDTQKLRVWGSLSGPWGVNTTRWLGVRVLELGRLGLESQLGQDVALEKSLSSFRLKCIISEVQIMVRVSVS